MLDRLALPQDASGETAAWSAPGVRLATWRGRMMPPFAGNGAEKRALAVYLATISGGEIAPGKSAPGKNAPVSSSGIDAFESHCAACHGEGSDWPLEPRVSGKTEQQIYEALGRLPELNPAMPPFEGTEDERRALARHLFDLPDAPEGGKP
jgi:mono/diheme cytochrome c family protein